MCISRSFFGSPGAMRGKRFSVSLVGWMLYVPYIFTTSKQLSGTPLHFGFRTPSDQAGDTDILESRKFGQQVVELENESDLLVTEPRQSPITER